MNTLADYGWTIENQQAWDAIATDGLHPARVIADFGTSLKIATPELLTAELSGKLAHYTNRENAPKVGDWVSVTVSSNNNAVIESVILRKNEIARKVTGRRTVKQVIAANVDIAFVLLALDGDFSVERLKRFLYQLSVSSIEPVIVLNKADKTNDLESYVKQLSLLAIPIVVTTATDGFGVEEIANRIAKGKTAILLGSSGVGKSTMTNKLLGRDMQTTAAIRESDSTGKHTTVHREIFTLPGGGLLVDTPGIRELQLWGTEDDLDDNYEDVAAIVARCKFTNCRHTTELGCAVNAALSSGVLDERHYKNYVKMKHELAMLAVRNNEKERQAKIRSTRAKKSRIVDDYSDEF